MKPHVFSWKRLAQIGLLTVLVGIGAYFVAWQFNDGKLGIRSYGTIFLAMAFPSLLLGAVMRLARPELQRYFAITGLGCAAIGLILLIV